MSMLIALCGVGALVHPPSPIASVAFDSCAGFLAALFFGVFEGAFVTGVGHLISATVTGFPLGYLHLPIALGMALAGAAIGLVNKANTRWAYLPALGVGVAINTVFTFVALIDPNYTLAITLGFAPFVFIAAVLNAVVAALAYVGLRGRL
jgi:hypothetical protein